MDELCAVDQWCIPDHLWEPIAELLPEHVNTHRFGGGRPRTPDRVCMEAILFVLRTGCQWSALDATRFCAKSTAHDRFQEWVQAGVFQAMWEAGLMAYGDWKGLDWSWVGLARGMTKAPPGEAKKPKRQAGIKARRWVVERSHSWMNRFRGILIRWNKKAENYIAMLHMAFSFIIYRRMGLTG